MKTMENRAIMGKDGQRSMFHIKNAVGVNVCNYSWYADLEQEVLIPPGAYFKILRHWKERSSLYIIEMEQLPPPQEISDLTFDKEDKEEPPSQMAAPTVEQSPNILGALKVTWVPPYDGGCPIEEYHLQYRLLKAPSKRSLTTLELDPQPSTSFSSSTGALVKKTHKSFSISKFKKQQLTKKMSVNKKFPLKKINSTGTIPSSSKINKQNTKQFSKTVPALPSPNNLEKRSRKRREATVTESEWSEVLLPSLLVMEDNEYILDAENLLQMQTYEVRMRARNSIGVCQFWSFRSGRVNICQTGAKQPDAVEGDMYSTLAPPRNSKKKGKNGAVLPRLLLWFDPPSDGGDPITRYRITYSKMPAYSPNATKIFNVFEVSADVERIEFPEDSDYGPHDPFVISVEACNSKGWGPPSKKFAAYIHWNQGDKVIYRKREHTENMEKRLLEREGFVVEMKYLKIKLRKRGNIFGKSFDATTTELKLIECDTSFQDYFSKYLKTLINGYTPIHNAAKRGHVQMMKDLLAVELEGEFKARLEENSHGTPNEIRGNGYSPLLTAIRSHTPGSSLDMISLLLKAKAKVNYERPLADSGSWKPTTPLLMAVQQSTTDVITILIEAKAEINRADNKKQRTPLFVACSKGSVPVVAQLLSKKASVNTPPINDKGLTCLHEAAKKGVTEVVGLLLDAKAEMHAASMRGQNALHISSEYSSIDTVKILLSRGCNVNAVARKGLTPLHYASKAGSLPTVLTLLEANADCCAVSEDGWLPLHSAASRGHHDVLRMIISKLQALGRSEEISKPNAMKYTPLMLAAASGSVQSVSTLLDAGETRLSEGFALAAKFGKFSVVQFLINAKADLTVPYKGTLPLMLAALGGHDSVVTLLLDHKADPNTSAFITTENSIDGPEVERTSLQVAVCTCGHKTIKRLIEAKSRVDSRTETNATPLHLAASHGSTDKMKSALKTLLACGAELEAQDNQLRTALWSAVECQSFVATKVLLESKASVDHRAHSKHSPRSTLLIEAIRLGNRELFDILMQAKADPNATLPSGDSTLHIAASKNGSDPVIVHMLERLVTCKKILNTANKQGMTPVILAAAFGQRSTCITLMESKADISSVTESGLTPAIAASYFGHERVLQVLLKSGQDVMQGNLVKVFDKNEDAFPRLQNLNVPISMSKREQCEKMITMHNTIRTLNDIGMLDII